MTDIQDISNIDTSKQLQNSEGKGVSTLKEVREEAGLSVFALAAGAGVSISTINRLESDELRGKGVTRRKANQVLTFLSQKLGRKITIEELRLNIT